MPSAPLPFNEQQRLAALQSYHILDTATDEDYDQLTELAATICGTPIALITFVDSDRQWFKSHKGTAVIETERALSFCAHSILNPMEILEVEDAKSDRRFKDNALVTGDPHISFYAGVPLVDRDGFALGSICVIDQQPKVLTDTQRTALRMLSKQLISKLEARKQYYELLESQAANELLLFKGEQLQEQTSGLNEWLNIAISAGQLGYTEVELATGIMRCNARFKNCYGRTTDEDFTYSDLFEAMLPQYREDVKARVAKAKAENSLYKAEYEVQWPDGSIHWISANGRPRYDKEGNADRMVGIVSDITERKQDEQRKSDFISMVSHELKTPITSISGYLQHLHSRARKAEDVLTVN
ncbi:MAG: PAS domain S-box protein, partial [Pedobacter sp.]